jgi:hypothetical protein
MAAIGRTSANVAGDRSTTGPADRKMNMKSISYLLRKPQPERVLETGLICSRAMRFAVSMSSRWNGLIPFFGSAPRKKFRPTLIKGMVPTS